MAPPLPFLLLLSLFLLPASPAIAQIGPALLQHPDLGLALFLPLSRHAPIRNLSSASLRRAPNPRSLADDHDEPSDANARMTLYDDLLTKGYYTTRLWIGTPPQEFALIVDTGSTVTYVPCSSCTKCGKHQDPGFNPEASSTYKGMPCGPYCPDCDSRLNQCKYERRYAEMSTSEGLLGDDLISFGNSSSLAPERLVFGCEMAETGDIFEQKADGIMGLGRGHLSVVDQLVERKSITAAFSLCYGGMDEGGGAMIMGAIVDPPDMIFTRSDFSRSAYYNLGLQQVIIADTPLVLEHNVFDSNFGTILDSGTTYAYFPDAAFNAFKSVLMQNVKLQLIPGPDPHYPDVCFEGAGSDVSKLSDHFPAVHLKFGDGQRVSLAPENYLFKHLKVRGGYCLGIFGNGKDSATLLGGIVVRNMLVTYDRVNQRIGFWKTNCSDLWNNLQSSLALPPVEAPAPSITPSSAPFSSANTTKDPGCVQGIIDVTILVGISYASFEKLQSQFLEDLSQALQIDHSQVGLISFTDTHGNVTVQCTIHIAATDAHLLNVLAKDIVDRLSNHEIQLSEQFRDYEVVGYNIKSLDTGSVASKRIIAIASTLTILMLFGGILFLVWWYRRRRRGLQYQSLQQNIEMSDQPQHS